MLTDLQEFWNFVLIPLDGGQALTVGKVVAVIFLLIGGYVLSRFIGYILGQRLAAARIQPDVAHTIKRVTFFALLVLVALTALSMLGVPITAFAFATGAIAIGVGFGAQNIINNFISGWILMAERPIRINDFIEIDGATGVVESIGTRSTRIRRSDGVHLLVPNSRLLEQTVVNWVLVDREIRTSIRVGVAYGSPVQKVSDLIRRAVQTHPDVKEQPEADVIFEDFGDNALIFDAYFWCDVGGEKLLREVRSEIRFRICELFDENSIVIAFPQRDVHIEGLGPIDIRMVDRNDSTD